VSRPFLAFTHPTSKGAGGARDLGGDTAGTADPSRPKGGYVPHNIMLSNKKLREEGGRGDVQSDGFCLPK